MRSLISDVKDVMCSSPLSSSCNGWSCGTVTHNKLFLPTVTLPGVLAQQQETEDTWIMWCSAYTAPMESVDSNVPKSSGMVFIPHPET